LFVKRLHVHVSVDDIVQSVRFYSTLFAAEPTVFKTDYAKWMLEDPRVNFAISSGEHHSRGIEHLGIQVEDEHELAEVYSRLQAADGPILDEGATVCCYAKSEKSWIADPQGVVWETFLTTGEAVAYGTSPALEKLTSGSASDGACCAPSIGSSPTASCGG
jgi:hypothetical protein